MGHLSHCEENYDTYFGTHQADFTPTPQQKRYTLNAAEPERNWADFDPRFDIAKNPNEFNRHGWIVEIDPFDPHSVPVKRTALGRFKHENAAVTVAKNRPVGGLYGRRRARRVYL